MLRAKGPIRRLLNFAAGKVDQFSYRSWAKRNAEHSYNLAPRLFELFLDGDRQYTAAYFRDSRNSLERAQLDKKAHIASKLNLKPGSRVLDIGCGWGGLALYLNREFGVDVLEVSIASEQIDVARQRAAAAGVSDRVRFEVKDYRDLGGRFDRIVNVGLIEHIGPPHYPTLFRKCHDLLETDGVMLSHFIGRMGEPGVTDPLVAKYIFPGGYIPTLSEIVSVTQRERLIISDVEALKYHYAHTLEEWYRRTSAARDEIVALYDEFFFRMWQFYLAGAEAAFRHGGLVNYQIQLLKHRDAVPMIRGETEQELFAGERRAAAE